MAEDGVDQPEGREASVELGASRLETPLVLAAVTAFSVWVCLR
jgi:hypothetical protein